MYDRKAVRRRRAVLGLLVVCSLILLTAYFGEGASGGLHSAQRGFLEVVSPIQEGASRALKPFRDLFGWFSDTFHAKSENGKLTKQVQQWRSQAIANAGAQQRVSELESMLHLDHQHGIGQMRPVTARVTVRNPSVWYATITIDKGSNAGVRSDEPVVTGDGLVGTVSTVTPTASVVTLITDHGSGVSATVAQTRSWGIVQPATGDPNDMRLDFIRNGSRLRPGQDLVTAGTSSSRLVSPFPYGIPIGTITKVDTEELALYQSVHVKPFADFHRLDFVQVLTDPHAGGT